MRNNPHLPLIPAGVMAVRLSFWAETDNNVQIFTHDMLGDAPTLTPGADLVTIVNSVAAQYQANFPTVVTGQTTLTQVTGRCLTDHVTAPWEAFIAPGTTGVVGAEPLPLTVAAVVTKRTTTAGQHGRGRAYMPAVPENFCPVGENNKITPVAALLYENVLAGLVATVTPASGVHYNGSLTEAFRGAAVATRGEILLGYRGRELLGNQRRRRLGRGI